jgi:hypothetical protein
VTHRIISIVLAVALVLSAGLVGCGAEEIPEYNLTICATEGGEVTTPGDGTFSYGKGTAVPLVVFPHTGYRFVNWTGDVDTIDDVNAASTIITMNGDYSITANFVPIYCLTISSGDGGSVTTPGHGTFIYNAGKVVNLVATPATGHHFVIWEAEAGTFGNATAAQTIFTMPAQNVTVTANFAVDLYFRTDAWVALSGPETLPPEERNPCLMLEIMTNIVVGSVRVDLPDGRSVIVPPYTDVFSPEVEGTTVLYICEPGMPIAGGEYIFTALDVDGESIPGVRSTDIWVGVDPPNPPTNVRAELTEDGISVSWDESPIIPGSFEPVAQPQLGCYQLIINRVETGESVYGANGISVSSYLIPRDTADSIEGKDWGISLGELEDGTYRLDARVISMAPEGSLGRGGEYNNSDPGQNIIFTVQNGEITIR